ncbi:MAG: hypothetical protein WD069_19655 [Planctomycetales bacterium]
MPNRRTQSPPAGPVGTAAAGLLLCLMLAGCSFGWPFVRRDAGQQFEPLPPAVDKAQLVERLNLNASRIIAWRCNDATITAKGVPARLTATIAVESPQRFRLVASSITGNEADFGSNDDRFWFWMRRGEPRQVFTVSHEDFRRLGPRLQIPFQPDWLMEVLGVSPIDANEYQLAHDDPQRRFARLTAERLMPDGRAVRRSIVVDTQRGGVIVEHSLYDDGGRLLAKASLLEHRMEPAGVTMPHQVRLEWPPAGLELTLSLGPIEINPLHLHERMWEVPAIPDSPTVDLGAMYDRRHAVQPAGFGR